jgi:hypothetical protein
VLRVILAACAVIVFSGTAVACPFVTADGRAMVFVEASDDPLVTVDFAGSGTVDCWWLRSAEGTGLRISCANGKEGFFERIEIGGAPAIAFLNEAWRRECDDRG